MRHGELDVVRLDEEPNLVEALGETASLRLLVDQFPAVFWTTDNDLRFTSSLGAGLAGLGLGPNQLVGMRLEDFFEREATRPLDAHRRALRGHSVTFLMHWGGRAFHAHVAPLRDAEGRPMGTICVAMDFLGSVNAPAHGPAIGFHRRDDDESNGWPDHQEDWRLTAPG